MKANSVCWLRSASATASGNVAGLSDDVAVLGGGYVLDGGYGYVDSGFSPACSI